MNISGSIIQHQSVSGNISYRIPIQGTVGIARKQIGELWFGYKNDFPDRGSQKILYIATDEGQIFYWTGDTYHDISGTYEVPIVAKTTEEWAQSPSIASQLGWLYIYTDYRKEDGKNIPAMKIGDGNAYVIDLPFFSTGVTESDRQRWDNKVALKMSDLDDENLIFYTD